MYRPAMVKYTPRWELSPETPPGVANDMKKWVPD